MSEIGVSCYDSIPCLVDIEGVGFLNNYTKSDSNSEPPPLDETDRYKLNESVTSSTKSVKLPRAALREISNPRKEIVISKESSTEKSNDSHVKIDDNENRKTHSASELRNEHLTNKSRSEAKAVLQKASTGCKKFIPASVICDKEAGHLVSNDHNQITAAAVSAAMGAAIPYLKGQNDLENQVRLLVEKISKLEENKIIQHPTRYDFSSEFSNARIERHLAELTEKRLQLLERILEKERKLEMNPSYDLRSDSSNSAALYPVNYVDDSANAKCKPVRYTPVATEPRRALLSKASHKSKHRKNATKSQSYVESSSLIPRDNPPKPSNYDSELLKEILEGVHNDSSIHTLNTSGIEVHQDKKKKRTRHDSIAQEAENRILTELALLKDELMTLKAQQPAEYTEILNILSRESGYERHEEAIENRINSSLSQAQLDFLRKHGSKLFSQYFQEYTTPAPVKLDYTNLAGEGLQEPMDALNELRNFRRKCDLEKKLAEMRMKQRNAYGKVDQLCLSSPDDYHQMKRNIDKEIMKIQAEVQYAVNAIEFNQSETAPVDETVPKKKGSKSAKTSLYDAKRKPLSADRVNNSKPTAKIPPYGGKPSNNSTKVKASITAKHEVNEQVAPVSETQLAYQQLILQRQAEYRQKLDKLQRVPTGSNIQSAGLVYNRNFYPIKGKLLGKAPDTKEAGTETKFQVDEQVQTDVSPEKVKTQTSKKRVDVENVVSSHKLDKLAIENLPSVAIEGDIEDHIHVEEPVQVERDIPKDSPKEDKQRLNNSDVIIVPGYGNNADIKRRGPVHFSNVDTVQTYRQFQSCLEDEIMSHILRNVVENSNPVNYEFEASVVSEDSSSIGPPENEHILQIFIDAGIYMNKEMLRKIGEEEVFKMLLAILEEQDDKKKDEKLRAIPVQRARVPTPTGTYDDYTPVESDESEMSYPKENEVSLIDRGVSPVEFHNTEQPVDSSVSESVPLPDRISRQSTIDREVSPRTKFATPERTPPDSPESSVVEVSVSKEVPPSPEKVLPVKTLPAVIDEVDSNEIGVQYETPRSFRDCQTSPIHFAPQVVQRAPVETTSAESSGSSTSEYHSTTGTTEGMSDHEWVLPHHELKSEGELTPRRQRAMSTDLDTENDLLSRGSISRSEGEVLRPAARKAGGPSSHIKGPVTEALYEMRHLMAASNQHVSSVPKMERRRFKPYSGSIDGGGDVGKNGQTSTIRGIPNESGGAPGSQVSTVEVSPHGPEDYNVDALERVEKLQPHPPDTERSTGGGNRSARRGGTGTTGINAVFANDDQNSVTSPMDSGRTSSAYRLPLDALNTEESVSDIEEIL